MTAQPQQAPTVAPPTPTQAPPVSTGAKAKAANALQYLTDRLRGKPSKTADLGTAGGLIREANRVSDGFLKSMGTDLGSLVQRNGLAGNLAGLPELQVKVAAGRPLNVEETAAVLTVLRDNEHVQRFLIERLARIPTDEFNNAAIGLSLRKNLLNPDVMDAAFVRATRTKFVEDLAKLAGPQHEAKIKAELEAALGRASPEGRVSIREIVFGKEGARPAFADTVPVASPEIEAELNSIRRKFEAYERGKGVLDVNAHIKKIDDILKAYEKTLPPGLEAHLGRAELIAKLNRDITELTALRQSTLRKDVPGFMPKLEDALQPLKVSPQRTAIETYLGKNAANATLLETVPAIVNRGGSAVEALQTVRDSTKWRKAMKDFAKAMFVAVPKGLFQIVFGEQLTQKQVLAAIERGEQIKLGVIREHPVISGLTLLLAGYVAYRYWYVPKRKEEKEEEKLTGKIILNVRESEVYDAANAGNRAFLLDPANRYVALSIVNDETFRFLATRYPKMLDAKLTELRADLSANETLKKAMAFEGETKSKALKEVSSIPLEKYRRELKLSIAKDEVDTSPLVERTALSKENQAFLKTNEDIWYWYNLRANDQIRVQPERKAAYTKETVGADITAIREGFEKLGPRDGRVALGDFRKQLEELSGVGKAPGEAPTVSKLIAGLEIAKVGYTPPAKQEVKPDVHQAAVEFFAKDKTGGLDLLADRIVANFPMSARGQQRMKEFEGDTARAKAWVMDELTKRLTTDNAAYKKQAERAGIKITPDPQNKENNKVEMNIATAAKSLTKDLLPLRGRKK